MPSNANPRSASSTSARSTSAMGEAVWLVDLRVISRCIRRLGFASNCVECRALSQRPYPDLENYPLIIGWLTDQNYPDSLVSTRLDRRLTRQGIGRAITCKIMNQIGEFTQWLPACRLTTRQIVRLYVVGHNKRCTY